MTRSAPAPPAARSASTAGLLYALTSATGFGALPILFLLATRAGFERHSLLAQRFLLAGLLLLLGLALTGGARVTGRRLATCVLLGFLGYASQSWMYFTAVGLGGAGLATVLLYLYPGFVTLLAWALHGERPAPARVGALVLALAGSLLTCALGPVRPSLLGVAASVSGALLYALYLTVSGTLLRDVKALPAGAWVCLGTGAAFALLALASGRFVPADTGGRLAYVVALALLGTIVPVVALFAAITRLGVARTAVVSTVEPVITLALAAALLGERFNLAQVTGALLIVSSVLVIQREGG